MTAEYFELCAEKGRTLWEECEEQKGAIHPRSRIDATLEAMVSQGLWPRTLDYSKGCTAKVVKCRWHLRSP